MDDQYNGESLTIKNLKEEYKKYEELDRLDPSVQPKEGDLVKVSKVVKKDNNYFKASPEVEQEILKMVKEDYKKMVNGVPDDIKDLMNKF